MWRVTVVAVLGAVVLMACGPAPSTAKPSTFTEVYAHFFPVETHAQCNKCHSNPENDISNGNLSMGTDKATAYAAIMGATSTSSKCGGQPMVVSGDAEASLFFDKLKSTPTCGGRMPLGGNELTEQERTMVRSWIDAGAKDN